MWHFPYVRNKNACILELIPYTSVDLETYNFQKAIIFTTILGKSYRSIFIAVEVMVVDFSLHYSGTKSNVKFKLQWLERDQGGQSIAEHSPTDSCKYTIAQAEKSSFQPLKFS